MEFIKNEKEREALFFKLWYEEVKINPKHYQFIFGNDLQLFKGITKEDLQILFDFCNKYHKLFKYYYHTSTNDDQRLIRDILQNLETNDSILFKHVFDYD